MEQKSFPKRRAGIILFAVVISIILYLTGVYSGLHANRIIKQETEQDIRILKEKTAQELGALENYINFLDTNLKSMQLEQTFIETLDQEQMCGFLTISLDELVRQLHFYWDKLPFRIEEYEKNNKPSQEYLTLKQQYTHLSIRTWLLAKKQYDRCKMDIVHGLYFYAADCNVCVEQGEQIDRLSKMVSDKGSNMIMFPIDFYSSEPVINNLKKYYNITSTPSIIINDNVFQGRLFGAQELAPKQNKQKR